MTPAERKRRSRAARKAAGMTTVSVDVPAEMAGAVRLVARILNAGPHAAQTRLRLRLIRYLAILKTENRME